MKKQSLKLVLKKTIIANLDKTQSAQLFGASGPNTCESCKCPTAVDHPCASLTLPCIGNPTESIVDCI